MNCVGGVADCITASFCVHVGFLQFAPLNVFPSLSFPFKDTYMMWNGLNSFPQNAGIRLRPD